MARSPAARQRREVAAEHGDRARPSTGTSFKIARASVDLPLPDSPTTPSVSPGASVEIDAVDGPQHARAGRTSRRRAPGSAR